MQVGNSTCPAGDSEKVKVNKKPINKTNIAKYESAHHMNNLIISLSTLSLGNLS